MKFALTSVRLAVVLALATVATPASAGAPYIVAQGTPDSSAQGSSYVQPPADGSSGSDSAGSNSSGYVPLPLPPPPPPEESTSGYGTTAPGYGTGAPPPDDRNTGPGIAGMGFEPNNNQGAAPSSAEPQPATGFNGTGNPPDATTDQQNGSGTSDDSTRSGITPATPDASESSAADGSRSIVPPPPSATLPLKRALADLKAKHYEDSLTKLNKILESNPRDAQAHYVKGVVLVITRRYPQAIAEYTQVTK
ncbi:MAG: hypothetical protein ACRD3W_08905, partial [Terriglobales bacterium]